MNKKIIGGFPPKHLMNYQRKKILAGGFAREISSLFGQFINMLQTSQTILKLGVVLALFYKE